jgi:N-acetylmuramoyl-L-alanine amidase
VAPSDARALRTEAGPIVPVVAHDGAAYRVRTPCGLETSVVDGTPIATADVVLDPGHGGDEEGAIGANGIKEKDVNLAVAERVRDRLEDEGYRVVLTRTGDYRVTLATRAELALALEARAFVSVHHNAVADGPSDGPGSETYHQIASPDSRRLAGLVYEEVVRALDAYDVAWEADRDAGAKYRSNRDGDDYYGILRRSAGVPAVLSEAAYVSNPAEAELLADPDVQAAEGDAIARAVVRFLTTDDPGSGFVEPYARSDDAGPGGGPTGCIDPPL